jgi:hypothetical protein
MYLLAMHANAKVISCNQFSFSSATLLFFPSL